MHVIFVAFLMETTAILNIDMRMFSVSLTGIIGCITTPGPLSNCSPLASQVKLLATPVQVNSATPLIEALTARGGIIISVQKLKAA